MDGNKACNGVNRIDVIQTVKTPLGFFVLVVLVVEALLAAIALRSDGEINHAILYSMVGIIVLLIGVVSGMAIWRPDALRGRRAPANGLEAEIVYPPNEKMRYERLFSGFDADRGYMAFNPPFEVEYSAPAVLGEAVRISAERYRSKTESRYLFYTETSYKIAQDFFAEVADKAGVDLGGIVQKVFWRDAEELPGFTFFLGYKNGKPVIILYPRAVMEGGIPRAVIYIVGAEDLHSILSTYFNKQWSRARTQ